MIEFIIGFIKIVAVGYAAIVVILLVQHKRDEDDYWSKRP